MENLSLREYGRKIEEDINNHQLKNALNNCVHVLNVYPKCVEIHRLLGKTFLEFQYSSVAQLIFEKILQVYPDDLVAHIGLSYLHEKQENLISSITHLEKAFEIQPTNPSFRDEIKRLRLKKDGIEPSQIPLTRGALVKMYARSGLYSQAIAEIKVGMHEHPNRDDFKVALAKMYDLNGDFVEAIEVSIDIIASLPYCFEANRILYERLHESSNALDISVYRKRLIELDPYFQYVSKKFPGVNDIPDVAILVKEVPDATIDDFEEVDWRPRIEQLWHDSLDSQNFENLSEIDWDTIIDKHINNEDDDKSGIEDTKSIKTSLNEMEQDSQIEPSLTTIPDWIFDEEPPSDNDISHTGTEVEISTILEEKISSLIEIDDAFTSNESGMIDENAPVSTIQVDPSDWVKDSIAEKELYNDFQNSEKTKEVKVKLSPKELLIEGQKAITGENISHALEKYATLLNYQEFLPRIIEDLNKIYEKHSNNPKMLTILGEAYARSGDSKRALLEFQKAEKFMEI